MLQSELRNCSQKKDIQSPNPHPHPIHPPNTRTHSKDDCHVLVTKQTQNKLQARRLSYQKHTGIAGKICRTVK